MARGGRAQNAVRGRGNQNRIKSGSRQQKRRFQIDAEE